MDTLKKFFPLSWKYSKDVANVIVGILVHLIIGIVAGALIWLSTLIVGWIPVLGALVGWALGVVSAIVDLYVVAGIVIELLVFFKVIK